MQAINNNTLQARAGDGVALATIKGDAMNKGRARVWVELPEETLQRYGFKRGDRIDVARYSDHITIERAGNGARKVAGRERRGRTICIFDICFPAEERARMFDGAPRLSVLAWDGVLRIVREEA